MNERIRQLRKTLGLTLEKFGEPLGVKKNSLSQIENGINGLTEQLLKAICREWNVNEEWLRTGEGDMFREISRAEEAAQIVSSSLDKLSSDEWAFVKRILLKLR